MGFSGASSGTNQKRSSSSSSQPTSSFYMSYMEHCRAYKLEPLKQIAHQKVETILDINTNKISHQQWIPILSSLKFDSSLYAIAIRSSGCYYVSRHADIGENCYYFKKHGSLFTAFTMNNIWTSLSHCLDVTKTLTYLELDGMPLGGIINIFFQALKRNKTLRVLSIKNCDMSDGVCQTLCSILQNMWNISELNLTACGLGVTSAEHIARLIKYQQIERCIQKWQNFINKEDKRKKIAGLRVINLQNNPGIGDEGLTFILSELFDDSWIKVLDMRSCGITNKSAQDIFNLALQNPSLQVVNFGHNKVRAQILIKVFHILKNKKHDSPIYKFTYKNSLTSKYSKWTSIIPQDQNSNALVIGNLFKRLFRKCRVSQDEDLVQREESFPRTTESSDLYHQPESSSAYLIKGSIFYNKKKIILYKHEQATKTSSINKKQTLQEHNSTKSLGTESVINIIE